MQTADFFYFCSSASSIAAGPLTKLFYNFLLLTRSLRKQRNPVNVEFHRAYCAESSHLWATIKFIQNHWSHAIWVSENTDFWLIRVFFSQLQYPPNGFCLRVYLAVEWIISVTERKEDRTEWIIMWIAQSWMLFRYFAQGHSSSGRP